MLVVNAFIANVLSRNVRLQFWLFLCEKSMQNVSLPSFFLCFISLLINMSFVSIFCLIIYFHGPEILHVLCEILFKMSKSHTLSLLSTISLSIYVCLYLCLCSCSLRACVLMVRVGRNVFSSGFFTLFPVSFYISSQAYVCQLSLILKTVLRDLMYTSSETGQTGNKVTV